MEPVGHNQRVGKVPRDQRTIGGRQIHTDDANLLFAFELMKIAGSGGFAPAEHDIVDLVLG